MAFILKYFYIRHKEILNNGQLRIMRLKLLHVFKPHPLKSAK